MAKIEKKTLMGGVPFWLAVRILQAQIRQKLEQTNDPQNKRITAF
jgi:hypothetical protein